MVLLKSELGTPWMTLSTDCIWDIRCYVSCVHSLRIHLMFLCLFWSRHQEGSAIGVFLHHEDMGLPLDPPC